MMIGGYGTGMDTRDDPESPLFIAEWMVKRHLEDKDMARMIGVSRPTVGRWREEQHRLTPRKIGQIAIALEITPEELWRPPDRPSVDALLKDEPIGIILKAIEIISVLLKKIDSAPPTPAEDSRKIKVPKRHK
jgi:transcriptional regulator with XRE-family HTH domain